MEEYNVRVETVGPPQQIDELERTMEELQECVAAHPSFEGAVGFASDRGVGVAVTVPGKNREEAGSSVVGIALPALAAIGYERWGQVLVTAEAMADEREDAWPAAANQ